MFFDFICELCDFWSEKYAVSGDKLEIFPELCPPNMEGDLTVNCFRFAKVLRTNPMEIAKDAGEFLEGLDDVESVGIIKAIVNVTLKPEAIFRSTLGDIDRVLKAGFISEESRKRILIEYSAPNTNKPQHLGHVRNNTLGMSLASLLARVGHKVFSVNLINDRGIHICKSMIAYQRFGDKKVPSEIGLKGDHFVGDLYVKYNDELTEQIRTVRNDHPDLSEKKDEELFLQTEIGQATQEMLLAWEAKDPEVRKLWKEMNSWVIAGFGKTYKRMGINFDKVYFESETYLLGKDIVEDGLSKNIFFKRDDGAILVDLDKLGQKVLLRADGTSVYITQDIGATIKKHDDLKADEQIWVVGDEQILHFKQLFATLKKLAYGWADLLSHLSYGMVNLPSGKMKSREGAVVDADNLFDEMHELAKEAVVARDPEANEETVANRAEIIAMGALKFMLLKFNPKTTMMFDPEESVKFEGDTGPYVQYACARINSIERKALEKGISADSPDWSLASSESEKKLATRAFMYSETLKTASERRDCSVLVNYLLDLAKDFNKFYNKCPVLNAEDTKLVETRLTICLKVREILTDGLKTLTIDVPDKM